MLVVVAAMDPSGENEQALVNAEIAAQVLGDLSRLVEGIGHAGVLGFLSLAVEETRAFDGPRQDKGLEIGWFAAPDLPKTIIGAM